MRLRIDHELCTGHGRCYSLAPRLVTDDDEGYGQIVGPGTVTDEQLELARKAVSSCPERAVTLDDV